MMEKEITENLIEIMKAYLKGEVIEERVVILGNRTSSWSIHVGNDWNTAKYEYRIKPKQQCHSFNNTEESIAVDKDTENNDNFEVKPVETYSVYIFKLTAILSLVKTVKETLHLSLIEARDLVYDAYKTSGRIKNLSKEAAHEIAVNINENGGRAYIKEE